VEENKMKTIHKKYRNGRWPKTLCGRLSTSQGRVGISGAVSSGLWKSVTCRQCLNKRNVRLAKNKYCSHCNREYWYEWYIMGI